MYVCVVICPGIRTIATNVGHLFGRLGIKHSIVYVNSPPLGGYTTSTFSPSTHPADWYLIIGTVQVDPLPSKYIAWQIEQIDSPHITPRYVNTLQRATYTWHFSAHSLQEKPTPSETSFVVPLLYAPGKTRPRDCARTGRILFYGSPNHRRNTILQALRGRYGGDKVIAKHGVMGDALDQLIQNVDMVVNLHYYTRASLEMARINEVLRNGRKVVTECGMPVDHNMNREMYPEHAVCIVPTIQDDLSNIAVLYEGIDKTLADPVMQPPHEIEDMHLSYLQRALDASGIS